MKLKRPVALLATYGLLTSVIVSGAQQIGRRSTAFGRCPAFTHYHPTVDELESWLSSASKDGTLNAEAGIILDGKCHRDDDDTAIANPHRQPRLHRRNEAEPVDPATLPKGWMPL